MMNTKEAAVWAVIVLLGSVSSACGFLASNNEPTIVGIVQIVEHPALNAVRDGTLNALAEAGYGEEEGVQFLLENAQGSPVTARTIVDQFIARGASVIVPITTPCAQAAAASTTSVPIVFGAVTNPVGDGIVDSLSRPGANITGVSDLWPIQAQVELILEITPDTDVIGVLYNPGEANNDTTLPLIRSAAQELGITVRERGISASSEIRAAATSLVGTVDVFYTAADSTVASGLEALIGVAEANQIPLFVGDTDSVRRGGIAAIGADYAVVGRLTGELVARVLEGEEPGDIPVVVVNDFELVVNEVAARRMGVTIPEAVRTRASEVIR